MSEPSESSAPTAPSTPSVAPASGELIAALSGALLLVAMIGLKWFGIAAADGEFAPHSGTLGAQSAWETLTTLRWLMVLTIAAALAAGVLKLLQHDHGVSTDVSLLVAALGSVTSLLLIYRVLIALPGSGTVVDQKLGAILGLLCAIGIAFGGFQSRRETRLARSLSRARERPRS
jgi:hypothetical protein